MKLFYLMLVTVVTVVTVSCQDKSFRGTTNREPVAEKSPIIQPPPIQNPIYTPPPFIPQQIPIIPNIPIQNTLHFGKKNVVWHLGDGEFDFRSNKDCYLKLLFKKLEGVAFNFNFTVQEPNTRVTIFVKEICGVTLSQGSNLAYIIGPQGEQVVSPREIVKGDKTLVFQDLILNTAGAYRIRIESNVADLGGGYTNRDDILVGDVQINFDRPIIIGEVTEF